MQIHFHTTNTYGNPQGLLLSRAVSRHHTTNIAALYSQNRTSKPVGLPRNNNIYFAGTSQPHPSLSKNDSREIRRLLNNLTPFLPLKLYDEKLAKKNRETDTHFPPISLYRRFLELPASLKQQVMEALKDPLLPLKLHDPTLEGKRELCDVLWELAYENKLDLGSSKKRASEFRRVFAQKRQVCQPAKTQLKDEIKELIEDGQAPPTVRDTIKKILIKRKRKKNSPMNEHYYTKVLQLMGWEGQLPYYKALDLSLLKGKGRRDFQLTNPQLPYHRRKYALGLFETIIAAHLIGDATRCKDPKVLTMYYAKKITTRATNWFKTRLIGTGTQA